MQLWRPEFELDGKIQAVGTTDYQQGYMIDSERLYSSCVQSSMLHRSKRHGSKTSP